MNWLFNDDYGPPFQKVDNWNLTLPFLAMPSEVRALYHDTWLLTITIDPNETILLKKGRWSSYNVKVPIRLWLSKEKVYLILQGSLIWMPQNNPFFIDNSTISKTLDWQELKEVISQQDKSILSIEWLKGISEDSLNPNMALETINERFILRRILKALKSNPTLS